MGEAESQRDSGARRVRTRSSSVEQERLDSDPAWKHWGPYLAERAWGTVREDYSEFGTAWEYFPHDHARSRAYRWSEDGLAGICDDHQLLCLSFAFWNTHDPILKERIFGLTGTEGNHGEDAKEYWWYEDSTPTHSYMRWRYAYPQASFPYDALVAENARRSKLDPEFELLDTGVFAEDRYFDIVVEYAKQDPENLCVRLSITNRGPEEAPIAVLPTLWFRNVWSWGIDDPRSTRPELEAVREDARAVVVARHPVLGERVLSGPKASEILVCENETNTARLFGVPSATRYPKDGINDHVVSSAATVNPTGRGTKAALRYDLVLGPGETKELELCLSHVAGHEIPREEVGDLVSRRRREADQYYADILEAVPAEEAMIARKAFAGLLFSKQLYHYNVERWLHGDPAGPEPPGQRLTGRNASWVHVDNFDIIAMPDVWEYPWFAAWDLAFHCVALAHVDPRFAKDQLLLLGREWYMHPSGQIPAYEWSFSDVNPPVQAWAAYRVFEIDGRSDFGFLERVFHKLLLNFTWWVNRKDAEGNNVFEGGFLGLDNIGPFDRSADLHFDGHLEQSDGTAWMAMFCLNMLEIAIVLGEHDASYEDMAIKFFEHFAYIAGATATQGLWDEKDGFYYDVLHARSGERVPLRVRSLVGLIPLCAVTVIDSATLASLPGFARAFTWFVDNKPQYADVIGHAQHIGRNERRLLSVVDEGRLERILSRLLDEEEFLSPGGIRSVSAFHKEHPFSIELPGVSGTVDYEPGESTSGLFGGNSNWRGPVWFPINYLVLEGLRRFAAFFDGELTVELPTGSGRRLSLYEIVDELSDRLVGLYRDDGSGHRPAFGGMEKLQADPLWHDRLLFFEYFHGDSGAGLGASHQTGWTGLLADLVLCRDRRQVATPAVPRPRES